MTAAGPKVSSDGNSTRSSHTAADDWIDETGTGALFAGRNDARELAGPVGACATALVGLSQPQREAAVRALARLIGLRKLEP